MAIDSTAIQDIDLLLENSSIEIAISFKSPSLGAFELSMSPNAGVDNNPNDITIIHSQAIAISKIFYQKNKETQVEIINTLTNNLTNRREIARTAVLALFQIGAIDELISTSKSKFTIANQVGFTHVIVTINHLLNCAWNSFTKEQLYNIRAWCSSSQDKGSPLCTSLSNNTPNNLILRDAFQQIKNQVNKILVKDVIKRIESGYNPEINEDVIKIKEEILKFGFPSDLSQALDKIDIKFDTSNDAFDFKGTMDLLRSFTERLYRSILDQYGDDGKKVKEQDSEKVARFFKDKGLVNEHFADMIQSQRHFISDTASHRLKSREEDARLSKNMVIEMSLYLLRRFQNH